MIILNSINPKLELGKKISLDLNKQDPLRENLLSTNYIIKSIMISFDGEEEGDVFTKLIAIPIIKAEA